MKDKILDVMTRCFEYTTDRNTYHPNNTNDVLRLSGNCVGRSEVKKLKSSQSKENKNVLNFEDQEHSVIENTHFFEKEKMSKPSRRPHAQQVRRILQTRFNPYPKGTFDKIPKAHDHNNQLFKSVK
jgi:hypothetical protein